MKTEKQNGRTKDLLSIIVPVYNTGAFLDRCINSLLNQKYKNIEIILVDDGSDAYTRDLCDQFAKKDDAIRVLHKENEGLGNARNSGIQLSSGKYITFVDSDDYVHEDIYINLIEKLSLFQADCAFCDFCFVKENGEKVFKKVEIDQSLYTGEEFLTYMIGSEPESKNDFDFDMSVCKAVFLKEIVDCYSISFKSEREVICEDLVFEIDYLSHADRVVYCNESLYYYCENNNSLTHNYLAKRINKEKDLYYLVQTRLLDKWDSTVEIRLNRFFLGRVRSCLSQEAYGNGMNSFVRRLENMREIINDPLVRKVINEYPVNQNPIKIRLFNYLLKYRQVFCLYFLLIIRKRLQ